MENKIALITGASRGIGKGIAIKLASEGYGVAVVGTRDEAEIAQNLEEIKQFKNPVLYIKGNIGNPSDRQNIVEKCLKRFGKIDVLVNNAGVAPKQRLDLLETSEESMDFVMDINLKGTFFLTQIVAKEMIKQNEQGISENPKIINLSSVSAYTTSVNRPEYCISKAGLSMVTNLFADRLAEYGIYVYEIRPGVIKTDMTSTVSEKYDKLINEGFTPIKRWGYPQDIANAVSVLCSDMLLFSTGEVINVDGGFHMRRL